MISLTGSDPKKDDLVNFRTGENQHTGTNMKSYFTKPVSLNISKARGGKPASGFTLIELMIVVVIIAILAGIALPAYQKQMQQSRRSDGKAALQQLAARQEQYYTDNKTYYYSNTSLKPLGYGDGTVYSAEQYYIVSVANPTASCPITTCYAVQAAAQSKGGQNKDTACTPLTLNSQGVKGPSGCW